jgi:hypothetical protein
LALTTEVRHDLAIRKKRRREHGRWAKHFIKKAATFDTLVEVCNNVTESKHARNSRERLPAPTTQGQALCG